MKTWKSNQRFRKIFKKRKHRRVQAHPDLNQKTVRMSEERDFHSSGMSAERRWHIISAYGKVLERCSSLVEQESHLPFPKQMIREAICSELTENPDSDLRSHLEIAYAQLESFLPGDEFRVIEEFRTAGTLAYRMSAKGDPGGILASARILKLAKGDKAVKIQEKISNRMRERLRQIQAIGMPFLSVKACAYSFEI